jgi:hypothetical protein
MNYIFPTADLIKVNYNEIYVLCPFCKKIHIHGMGGDTYNPRQVDYGTRTSDCYKGTYVIKKTKLTTTIKKIYEER